MPKDRARVVVIGGGIAGSSIAYHLSELGWTDVLVLDQGELVRGTTSHAPGLVGQLRANATLARLLMYSVALYRRLRSDGEAGFFEVGSLRLASSRERWEEVQRQRAVCRGLGLEAEVVGPAEVKRLFPPIRDDGFRGALWVPSDGSARAPVLARALAEAARKRGVEFAPQTPVTGFDVDRGRLRAVRTAAGRIETEAAVCAAGIWSPRIGRMLGVSIPLVPMQHQYVRTEPLADLSPPAVAVNLRDPDRLVYLRQDGESLVLGGYEREPAPFDVDAIPEAEACPEDGPSVRGFDPERFAGLLAAGRELVPCLGEAPLAKRVNGLESFTPDGEFILGESAEVRGFWVASGFCAHGVSGAGGVGKLMAEWIVEGRPSLDVWHMDVRRFGAYARSRGYVRERSREVYSTYYDIAFPGEPRRSCRGLRRSSVYERLVELGAVFGEKAGWERADWFEPNVRRRQGPPPPEPRRWARRYWSEAIGVEHRATRENAALFDSTSFAKFEVSGRGALGFLQRVAANDVDRPPGSVVYTQLLNEAGGIECDLTITRLASDRFRLVTGTAFGPHDLAWLQRHAPDDGTVDLRDVTSSFACFGLWGPRSREVLGPVSSDDAGGDTLSSAAFPYLSARELTVGGVPVLAVRVTYVGELGWELYCPVEYGPRLWSSLWEAGEPLGLVAGGYRAIDSLRLEKGYRYWSADISAEHNPLDAGLGFAVKLDKGPFIGREALLQVKQEGLRRRLSCLVLDDPSAVVLGGEPVLADGKVVGRVTSGGYGYTVRRSIAYAYLPLRSAEPGMDLTLEWFDERRRAKVTAEPLYDPRGSRIRV
jgi:4-methylaminobutanoate oxidase (formaldehyde-forming)